MQKGKILVLTPFYPPNIGGAETFAEALVDELSKENYVDVLTFQPFTGYAKRVEYNPTIFDTYVTITRMSWIFKPDMVWQGTTGKHILSVVPKMWYRAKQLCATEKYDAVYGLGMLSSFIAGRLKKKFGIKATGTILALYDMEQKSKRFKQAVKWTLDQLDAVFVEGEGGAEEVYSSGINPPKIKKFNHWVDQSLFFPDSNKHNKKILNVLFVGRPVKEKGRYIIEGVEREVNTREINFMYLENCQYEYLPDYYRWADVLLVPSHYSEGFVRVVAEGASCGCAVITSNCGSLPEMVREFGIVCDPSIASFRKAIEMLHKDRKMLAQYKNSAYQYALEHFNFSNAEVFKI